MVSKSQQEPTKEKACNDRKGNWLKGSSKKESTLKEKDEGSHGPEQAEAPQHKMLAHVTQYIKQSLNVNLCNTEVKEAQNVNSHNHKILTHVT